jgi:starch synthase
LFVINQGDIKRIDTEVWDPASDKMLEKSFQLLILKKATNKQGVLFKITGSNNPLFSFIGRLLDERGDLLPHAAAMSLSENYQQ